LSWILALGLYPLSETLQTVRDPKPPHQKEQAQTSILGGFPQIPGLAALEYFTDLYPLYPLFMAMLRAQRDRGFGGLAP
jgi:hypothetical protein